MAKKPVPAKKAAPIEKPAKGAKAAEAAPPAKNAAAPAAAAKKTAATAKMPAKKGAAKPAPAAAAGKPAKTSASVKPQAKGKDKAKEPEKAKVKAKSKGKSKGAAKSAAQFLADGTLGELCADSRGLVIQYPSGDECPVANHLADPDAKLVLVIGYAAAGTLGVNPASAGVVDALIDFLRTRALVGIHADSTCCPEKALKAPKAKSRPKKR